MRLGIDFGTTRTVVAGCLDGRHPVATFDLGGEYRDYVPGVAAVDEDGVHYGWEAVARLGRTGEHEGRASTPALALRSIKRLVSTLAADEPVSELGGEISALELATGFLAHLRRLLVEHSNFEPISDDEALEVEVAVPAHSSSRQRYITLEAFTRAGFTVVGMRNEPTAAAVELAYRNRTMVSRRSPKRYVMIYDLGGGTFDTSAVSLEGRRFEVVATSGISRLGGDDFDEVIADMTLAKLGAAAGALAPGEQVALRELCREAKENLGPHSRRLMVDVAALIPDADPVILPVADIYERCEPLVQQTLACLDEVFAALPAHGIDPGEARELGALYLVGGAVAFPLVARALRAAGKRSEAGERRPGARAWGRKIQLAPAPHTSTAVGLAVCADPDTRVHVREAVTRHFGVWREAEGGREKVFDPILTKNQALDRHGGLTVHRRYRPAHAVGRLRFLECDRLTGAGQPAGELTPWTRIDFPYAPELADSGDLSNLPVERCSAPLAEEIAETYTYGDDGTVAVEIENLTHGYRRSFVLGTLR
ncbi:Hsp70 family protein [Haliangium sp.]|uniref:Hsp70 family protein n=1 Tax=Haliangium sp. TaxID=2663208 RepID=UPI003D097298